MNAVAAGGDVTRANLRRLRPELRQFIASAAGRRGLALLALLSLGLLLINGLNVLGSYVGRDFFSAIEHRDHAGFRREALLYLGVFALCTLAASVNRYMEERLGLLWRDWQTRRLLQRYFGRLAYYRIETLGEPRNPDQRIAEDVRGFTTTTLSLLLLGLNAAITIFSFSGVLWSISPRLLLVAVAYALAGSLLTVLVGRRLVGLNVGQLDCEANLRSELMHARHNAEALALARREEHLHRRAVQRLEALVRNTRSIVAVNLRLGLFSNGYNYLIQLIPALVIAPLFMRGEVEFGVITQSAISFAWLAGAFSLAVTQFQSISTYTAVAARLGQLLQAMDQDSAAAPAGLDLREGGDALVFDKLSLRHPDGGVLLRDLDLRVKPGAHLLVTSLSGHAKVALLRAVGGLECAASGGIRRPEPRNLVFVPERPYLPRSSLRQLLASSDTDGFPDDTELMRVLRMLQLEGVAREAGGLDAERDWSTLGVSEQVRLLIARVLIMRPLLVFLDRMKGALDPAQLCRVLALLAGHEIGYVTLGKPGECSESFDSVLDIAPDGGWTLRPREALMPRPASPPLRAAGHPG